jgi:triosephosphate isomerase
MMAETIIVANWKMYKTIGQAIEFTRGLKQALSEKTVSATIAIAPPFTSLSALKVELQHSAIGLAGQNMNAAPQGAMTGEISGEMLLDAGCKYCILGHSERRLHFGEDDKQINAKVIAALGCGLKPIFCIGETLAERESAATFQVISRQLKEGLNKVAAGDIKKVIIAYEPVWAIGTGKTATPQQAQEVHLFIRKFLVEIYGDKEAAAVSIIYGGSVNAENIDSLMAQTEVNGVLVGSASLELASFLRIINACDCRARSGLK